MQFYLLPPASVCKKLFQLEKYADRGGYDTFSNKETFCLVNANISPILLFLITKQNCLSHDNPDYILSKSNERRRCIWNVFSHWLKHCPLMNRYDNRFIFNRKDLLLILGASRHLITSNFIDVRAIVHLITPISVYFLYFQCILQLPPVVLVIQTAVPCRKWFDRSPCSF